MPCSPCPWLRWEDLHTLESQQLVSLLRDNSNEGPVSQNKPSPEQAELQVSIQGLCWSG